MNNSAYIYKKLNFTTHRLLRLLEKSKTGFLLESNLDNANLGRYSFFGIEPFLTIQCKDGIVTKTQENRKQSFKGNIFIEMRSLLNKYRLNSNGKKINFPFLAGAVGFLSYDLGFYLEKIQRKNIDDLGIPDLWFAFFDIIIAIDHYRDNLLIFSTGFPETSASSRRKRANSRLKDILYKLNDADEIDKISLGRTPCRNGGLESNLSHRNYLKTVNKSLDYITKGDIYQINLSQRFHTNTDLSDAELYANLKDVFPVPFGGILKTGDFSIISGSPERFLKYDGRFLVTRPMKGTRPRSQNRILDRQFKAELERSHKDKAELLMIVDLERNDLGRVCDYGSVKVEALRNFEEYSTVFQTTSQIRGRLYPEMDRIDIIKACFPGGSITGCPKIRAMQIIEELEPNRRGIYTGSLGYFSFNGNMDFNILIRSFLKKNSDVYFGVGGGIVYDSQPEAEYQETLVKAEALKKALKGSYNEAICMAGQ
ncbi:MAG: aminodeoxychorismate synthase component I [Candidatus Omnitrophica bacterium]|nr:aminodeoxychorismate synthase component I [Candidatus Omnitrophota bacterium]MDD5351665.1 aminodeoxychorismate synthase component I [Candidatus Omnitrophota bacterium]MDD5550875.1 aminodeoxychorismate synthase component I [Candidatus Omnitrophota bacterium]